MTYEELMRELCTVRFQNDELKRRLETAETELRARQTKAAPKKRAVSALSTNKKEGERILAKVRASIDAASRKGLQSTLAKALGSHGGSRKAIDLYADALGVSWDDACDRINQQHLTLRAAGQPYTPAR